MTEKVRCKECYYYTNGKCTMSLLYQMSVRPNNRCCCWMSNKTGNEYVARNIILGIREEKKK